jgi:energy-coupling factor transporter ATP-binding protein EcfA2
LDLFGLERERKISASGVRNIFTPHQPVQTEDLFFGRQEVVGKIIEHLNTPGQHALLFGDRGVGKSSLANITTSLLINQILQVPLYTKRCSSSDDFISIFKEPLENAGVEVDLKSRTTSHIEGGNAGLSLKVVKAGVHSDHENSRVYEYKTPTPSVVAELLKNQKGLLYIDEADQIKSSQDKINISEAIKLLSDYASPFKILVVGIAETGEEITAAHPSVSRCLKETKLEKMTDPELESIIQEGAKKLGITFEFPVVNAIVRLSSGYPHFTHLLALKCSEEVIVNEKSVVTLRTLNTAIKDAVNDAEGTLRRKYEQAVRSASTDMFKHVLLAAARVGSQKEFSAVLWREQIKEITGKTISQQELNNYLNRLVATDESCVIKRLGKGVYKFNDPRMPSFIKIANEDV